MIRKIGLTIALLGLMGCNSQINEAMISDEPVPASQIRAASTAAKVCARHAPNWGQVEFALKSQGYSETDDDSLAAAAKRTKSVFLEDVNSDVVVQLGSSGSEAACLIGVPGLTPTQSYQLALPWVDQFDLLTNEERGQGLSAKAVQAWGRLDEERIVYVAAYKAWDVFEVPGAAVRLIYISR